MFACKAIPFHYTTTLRRLLSLYCATFSCYTGPDSVQLLSIVVDNGSQSHNHNTHGKSYLIHPKPPATNAQPILWLGKECIYTERQEFCGKLEIRTKEGILTLVRYCANRCEYVWNGDETDFAKGTNSSLFPRVQNCGHVDAHLHITLSASGGKSCAAGASVPLIISPYTVTMYQYQRFLLHTLHHTIFSW